MANMRSATFSFFVLLSHHFCDGGYVQSFASPKPEEIEKAVNYVDRLLETLMNQYDKSKPSHNPVVIYSYMFVEHLKEFVSLKDLKV